VSKDHPDNLDRWVNRLSKQEMPIFARTAEHVTNVVARDVSSVAELSRGILQDASMTARLLRMANSAYYNPRSHSINTITRAVMVLGFETVRSMCLSFTLIETLLKGPIGRGPTKNWLDVSMPPSKPRDLPHRSMMNRLRRSSSPLCSTVWATLLFGVLGGSWRTDWKRPCSSPVTLRPWRRERCWDFAWRSLPRA